MSTISELKAFFAGTAGISQAVEVVSSTASTINVIGRSGMQTLRNDGSIYKQGDSLIIRDSTVIGLAARDNALPEYYL